MTDATQGIVAEARNNKFSTLQAALSDDGEQVVQQQHLQTVLELQIVIKISSNLNSRRVKYFCLVRCHPGFTFDISYL